MTRGSVIAVLVGAMLGSSGIAAAAMRILVADDDAVSRILLVSILSKWGHEVVQAQEGEEACTRNAIFPSTCCGA